MSIKIRSGRCLSPAGRAVSPFVSNCTGARERACKTLLTLHDRFDATIATAVVASALPARPRLVLGRMLRLIAIGEGYNAGVVGQRGNGGDALRLCVASE